MYITISTVSTFDKNTFDGYHKQAQASPKITKSFLGADTTAMISERLFNTAKCQRLPTFVFKIKINKQINKSTYF